MPIQGKYAWTYAYSFHKYMHTRLVNHVQDMRLRIFFDKVMLEQQIWGSPIPKEIFLLGPLCDKKHTMFLFIKMHYIV